MKTNDLIQSIETDQDGAWIYLKPGYHYDAIHCIHEDTIKQAKAKLAFIRKCVCRECVEDIAAVRP